MRRSKSEMDVMTSPSSLTTMPAPVNSRRPNSLSQTNWTATRDLPTWSYRLAKSCVVVVDDDDEVDDDEVDDVEASAPRTASGRHQQERTTARDRSENRTAGRAGMPGLRVRGFRCVGRGL